MQRQPDAERRAAADVAFQFDPPVVRADNPLDNHQAQAGALFLGRVKRLEDAVDLLLRNAAAGVGSRSPTRRRPSRRSATSACRRSSSPAPRFSRGSPAPAAFASRQSASPSARAPVCVFTVDAAVFHFRPQQFQGFFHHFVERNQLQLQRRRAGSRREIA